MPNYIYIMIGCITSFIVGLLGKIVFDWLKSNKNGNGFGKMKEDIKWIKDIHNKSDSDGLPLWYIPREWKKTLDVVSEKTTEGNFYLKEIRDSLDESKKTIKDNNQLLEKLIDHLENGHSK